MNYVSLFATTILITFLLSLGCSDDSSDGSGNGDTDNTQGGDDNQPDIADLDPEDICFSVDQGIDEMTSRVMLLEDKSGSMDDATEDGRGGGDRKWDIAVNAISTMVTTFQENIEFGLDLFPAGNAQSNCDVGQNVEEDVSYNNADNIIGILGDNGPEGATPLHPAMGNFLDAAYAPAFTTGESGAYLVVISDGMDTCDSDGEFDENNGATAAQLAEVTAALLADQGIQTFVIGFGGGIDPDQLNAIAAAGGTEFDTYFDAQNEEELNQALESIGQSVIVSCRYQLGTVSEDANRDYTNIYFDGEPLRRGETCTGDADWTWGDADMTVIEFCTDACALLESGGVEELNVIIMCNPDDVVRVV